MRADRLQMLTRDTIAAIAQRCCGELNLLQSSGTHLRFGSKGGLSVDRTTGAWNDFGTGGGGLLDLIVRAGLARNRADAMRWLETEGFLAAPAPRRDRSHPRRVAEVRQHEDRDEAERRAGIARRIWDNASPLDGSDLASLYLANRGLANVRVRSLRFGVTKHTNGCVRLPVLLAAVTPIDRPDHVRGVQRIYLQPPGFKADVTPLKAALGPIKGHGVVLGDIADCVIIAEGVETALSAGRIFRKPAVATLGADFFATLQLPARIRLVTIAADRGEVGERVAEQLRARLSAEGRAVRVELPPAGFGDWNDVIVAQGAWTP